jgi:hypothetical protein
MKLFKTNPGDGFWKKQKSAGEYRSRQTVRYLANDLIALASSSLMSKTV